MASREELNKDIQEEIENEEKRKKYKKITILFFKVILLVVICFTAFYFYTMYISTRGLIFKEKRIVSQKLPESFNSAKIVHFSDLHYGSTIELSQVKNIVHDINLRKPDLIIFTGDLIDKDTSISGEEIEKLIQELKKLNARISMYAVLGDEDDEKSSTILKQCGFTILDNASDLVYNDSNTPILITGLGNNPDIEKAFSLYLQNSNSYHIVLTHGADVYDEIPPNYQIDLLLAGGNLNGQICLTKEVCFIKKDGARKYYQEYYKNGNTELFISSGIGSGEPFYRFGARPSINFFRFAIND